MARTLIARLHALCEFDLLLCRQEGYAADLLEVHTDRIIQRNPLGDGEVNLDLRLVLVGVVHRLKHIVLTGFTDRRVVYNLDALIAEALIEPIHIVGGHTPHTKCFDEFATGQCAAVRLPLCYDFPDSSRSCHFILFNPYRCRLHFAPSFQFVILSNKIYRLLYR